MSEHQNSINMDALETAIFIGISERKVREMVKKKAIPSFKLGGRRLFNREAITKWIRQRAGLENREDD
ncbi:MAG TPA: hypothetical protein DCM28_00435 [Phycisphaerales bacterium]|nr:hypothetical protein [Phycisphaerales bacterium]|tara:strand:+ start:601 stop:804 length:204 start_codon:yes stop_codon:yes gene_type:complete